jgi:hypothetical protein
MDRLIGDEYQKPNGRRDVDTLVWKSTTLPVYTGTSPYAMKRSAIAKADPDPLKAKLTSSSSAAETKAADDYYENLYNRNLGTYVPKFFPDSVESNLDSSNLVAFYEGEYSGWRYVHAHGICGTPAPGGTEISATTVLISEPYGGRTVTTHFHMQPGDEILDPSRRLLVDSIGGSSAKLNFNISEHPSAAAGFPVVFETKVAPCKRTCPGGTGLWCSEAKHWIYTKMDTDSVRSELTVPEYKTCSCTSPAVRDSATGSCVTPPT